MRFAGAPAIGRIGLIERLYVVLLFIGGGARALKCRGKIAFVRTSQTAH
jgi:hypothetical protein